MDSFPYEIRDDLTTSEFAAQQRRKLMDEGLPFEIVQEVFSCGGPGAAVEAYQWTCRSIANIWGERPWDALALLLPSPDELIPYSRFEVTEALRSLGLSVPIGRESASDGSFFAVLRGAYAVNWHLCKQELGRPPKPRENSLGQVYGALLGYMALITPKDSAMYALTRAA